MALAQGSLGSVVDSISRSKLVGRLQKAAGAVRQARVQKAREIGLSSARAALTRAVRSLSRFAPEAARQVGAVEATLAGPVQFERDGNRWALAEELMRLKECKVPSWQIARALIAIGVCRGKGTPADVQRSCGWMRKQRERLRRRDKHFGSSRKTREVEWRDPSAALRSESGLVPEEKTMARKIRKTTTTTVEEFEDKHHHEPEEADPEETGVDTDDDEGDDEPASARPRKRR